MKRLFTLLTIVAFIFPFNQTSAQTATCQNLTVQLDGSGSYSFTTGSTTPQVDIEQPTQAGVFNGLGLWQSFTPTIDGSLNSISVYFTTAYTVVSSYLALTVYDGQGTGGALLFQLTYPVGTTFNVGWNELVLDQTLNLTSGTEYTFLVGVGGGEGPISIQKNGGNPYAGGISSTAATDDLVFRTKVLKRPDIDNGSLDNTFGLASFDVDISSFDCSNVGPNTVTLTVTNNNAGTSTCTSTVTVEDNEVPIASCVTGAPNLVSITDAAGLAIPDNDPIGTTATINVSGLGSILDLNVDLIIDHTWAGDIFVSLESPNSTVVTLIDRIGIPPGTFGCSDDGFDITLDDASFNDLETTCFSAAAPITGDYFPAAALAAFNGEDPNGTWTLFISDNAIGDTGDLIEWTLNITENGPVPLSLDASGNYTVMAATFDNGSSDNCGVTLTTDVANFSCADVGPQTVTLTATDPIGNSDNCTVAVDVQDNENPDAQCQNHTLVLNGSGSATLTVANINNGSSDNCGINTMSIDQTAFNCSDLGANTVMLTVNDVNGNTSSCSATVTVEDNQTPSIICPSNIVECAVDGSGVQVDYASVTGSDNCTFTISQTDASGLTDGDVFPVGTTTQEWTITDIALNTNSCSFTITVNPKPVADYSSSAACQGETTFFTDLSTIDASSSIASWQWDMNDGSSLIGLVDPSHVFADTGVYNVELVVTSAEGCTDTSTQAIHVGPVPSASFTFISACEGSITSFSSTSTIDAGTLTYFWDFGDGNTDTGSDPDHTYANDGTYTVTLTVTSDNGCVDVAMGSVEIYAAPTALFSASTECEGTATQFTNLSTGSGITDYSWDFGDSNSSILANPSHTYASSGSYTVVLTVTNGDGCVDTHTATVVVNALPNVDFSFSNICEGTSATFANSSSAGSYNWDFGDGNSSTLTSPSHVYNAFGTYDVTLVVTDAYFCINSGTQQIEVYDLPDFSLTPTDVACYGEASGSIEVDPLGSPTPTWSYSLNNGTPQISDVFAGIPAGTYDVTVVDGNACEFTLSTSVAQPSDTLGVDVSSLLDIACHGYATGEINLLGTGGTSPYTYSVDAGTPQSSGAFNGLSAGSHDIQIVDANSCVFDTTIVLSEPDTLVLGLVNAEDLLCNGDNSGNLEVSATGGVGPYEYNLDGGLYGMSGSFNGLEAAMYVVGVRDANGCEDTLHVTLTEPGILMLSLLNSEDANCFGESNGSIEVGAASGTPGYQYSLNGVNYVGSGLFEGLGAGTYTVYSKDANGCLDSVTETIFEPALLTIETNSTPVACFGESSGEIEIIATGGTPGPVLGYMFSINGGGSFQPNGGVFTNVASGSYLAVVADTNGCTASEGVVISQPTAAFNLSANVTNALCLDSASGSVQLLASGGTPTYSYSSDNVSFGSGNTFGGFAAGTYMLYGEDVNGCVDSVQVNVGEPATAVHITSILLNNPACPNQASGTATVQVSGGTPGYMYSGNAGNTFQSNQIITGLNGGNHLVVVKDANGCVDTDTITLTSPGIFDITVDTIIGVDCEGDLDGEIHVIAEGGTPSYNYTLNGGLLQSNGDYVNLTDGTYTIAIMDVNGCTYSESFTVSSAQMQPIADFGFSLSGTAVLFNNNSEYGDTYLWEFGDDSTSTVENPVHVYLTDGDYIVTLTVSNECGTDVTTALVSTTTIGITEEEKVTFSLFPNPASSVLNLRSNRSIDSGISVDIFSVSGQIVRTVQLPNISSSEVVTLDLSGLSNGLYSLRLTGEKVQSVLRFDIIK